MLQNWMQVLWEFWQELVEDGEWSGSIRRLLLFSLSPHPSPLMLTQREWVGLGFFLSVGCNRVLNWSGRILTLRVNIFRILSSVGFWYFLHYERGLFLLLSLILHRAVFKNINIYERIAICKIHGKVQSGSLF